jgi:hypothetical protein
MPNASPLEPRADRATWITLAADKGYDAEDFVNELRSMRVTPHVAQNLSGRSSAIDGRTTRHEDYGLSQRIRKRIEDVSAGSRRSPGRRRRSFEAATGWASPSPLRRSPIIWSGCGSCLRPREPRGSKPRRASTFPSPIDSIKPAKNTDQSRVTPKPAAFSTAC